MTLIDLRKNLQKQTAIASSTMTSRRGDPDKSKNHAKHGCVGFVECKVYFWVANATYKFLNKISFQTNDDSSWQLHSSDYFASRTLSIEISVRLAFWCPSGPEIRWDAFCSCCFLNLNKHAAEQNFRLVSDNSITVRHPLAILLYLAASKSAASNASAPCRKFFSFTVSAKLWQN